VQVNSRLMRRLPALVIALGLAASSGHAQSTVADGSFKLALASHPGQLKWHADGFKIVESSAKPNGNEIGLRGRNASGITFLGFLFLFSEIAPLDSAKCRDGVMNPEKKSNSSLRILESSEMAQPDGQRIALVKYTTRDRNSKTTHMMRGFVATGDLCGDLEFYSDSPLDDAELKKIFGSYHLDPLYVPQFGDSLLYGQVLYEHRLYKAAAPIFEQALGQLKDDNSADSLTMRRVATDQAGMAYGISGDLPKARKIFEAAIAKDPDYPLYYYNLACADAEEKKLDDAKMHLRDAFVRKANVIHGETVPDPSKDDSFLPYRDHKDFWNFIESLR
jgi:hypothetical protein